MIQQQQLGRYFYRIDKLENRSTHFIITLHYSTKTRQQRQEMAETVNSEEKSFNFDIIFFHIVRDELDSHVFIISIDYLLFNATIGHIIGLYFN